MWTEKSGGVVMCPVSDERKDEMSDVMICRTCLSTTADGAYTKKCFDGPHDLVEAVVTECPHVHRDKSGTIRHQNRVKANRACDADNHHPLLCQHVNKPFTGAKGTNQ